MASFSNQTHCVHDAVDDVKNGSQFHLTLPDAPTSEADVVKAWREPVAILTYATADPDPNPRFLERRVYQGSSGKVYPLPVIDRIETEPAGKDWDAWHLENEFLRIMVLPQLGGRIHIGFDKRNGYDFFYRQNVIKPALVGLAGPWISGGVEFNWPQHHRPATYMPVEVSIERAADGAVTVLCSDHDPMSRMKGMHGICLRPGKAYLEVRVRLYNRSLDTQTFLWWANVATRVHERYQSFFPKDVSAVADHAKRAVTAFPLSDGSYYGVDYARRAQEGTPTGELPTCFVPEDSYPANDLSWYANIPVPTSYMIAGSRGDFAGGYDHKQHAGLVSFANHHIVPGKKQWTWGNHEFGYAWNRSLTNEDGPYIELMVGAYTDNQPDFSFLAPGETKTFAQYWYPIRDTGVPDAANLQAYLRVETTDAIAVLHVGATELREQCRIQVVSREKQVFLWEGNLSPEATLHLHIKKAVDAQQVQVVIEQNGRELLRYSPAEVRAAVPPQPATEPLLPEQMKSSDELFLTGLHLEQYRHPLRMPEPYWREMLRRDSGDSRANLALGRWRLRRGELREAEAYFRKSIARLTNLNPNPCDGEAHYYLGLTLQYLGEIEDGYEALFKSTWNAAWRSPAHLRLTEIDCTRTHWASALEHLQACLLHDADNLHARSLIVIARLCCINPG